MTATALSIFAGAALLCAAVVSGFASTVPTMSAMGITSSGGKPAEFTLYSSDKCPYAQRTWIAARELGVPFEFHAMELGKDNREEWFLKLNPLGKVPTVVCGDDVIYESLVINEYLVDAFPPGGELGASPLLPESPNGRAKARMIAARSNDLVTAFFTYLSNNDEKQEEEKREKFVKELRALDGWAAAASEEGEECGWLCGKEGNGCMTLADISYFPFLERIDATLKPFKGWGLSEIEVPALVAWMGKCREKESVAFTLKDPAIWAELYKKFLGANYFVRAGIAKD